MIQYEEVFVSNYKYHLSVTNQLFTITFIVTCSLLSSSVSEVSSFVTRIRKRMGISVYLNQKLRFGGKRSGDEFTKF